jgi:hypothetical protein
MERGLFVLNLVATDFWCILLMTQIVLHSGLVQRHYQHLYLPP